MDVLHSDEGYYDIQMNVYHKKGYHRYGFLLTIPQNELDWAKNILGYFKNYEVFSDRKLYKKVFISLRGDS